MTEADKKALLQAYYEKKKAGELSSNLFRPSPANLRDECLITYKEQPAPDDEDTLRLFFAKSSGGDYTESIRGVDIDKFRPLTGLLNGRVVNPNDKHYRLLAWLMRTAPKTSEQRDEVLESSPPLKEEPIPGTNAAQGHSGKRGAFPFVTANVKSEQKKPAKTAMTSRVLIVLALLLFAGSGIWLYQKYNGGCMYWTGDHFQPSPCTVQLGDTALIAYDAKKATHLQRITRPDTITYRAIGRVWYVKTNGGIEYYTSGGFHPIDTRRRLKPITAYMIDKYIARK